MLARRTSPDAVPGAAMPLVQWRAVFGGAVLSLAGMILLTMFWLALGYGSEVDTVRGNLEWFIAGSAIFSMLLGGYLAGWMSGVRGVAAGLVNGLTVWGLFLLTAITLGTPAVLNVIGLRTAQNLQGLPTDATWTTFWALLIGFAAAGIGGLLGGVTPRTSGVVPFAYGDHEDHDRHDHDEHDHDRIPPHEHRGGEAIATTEERRRTAS